MDPASFKVFTNYVALPAMEAFRIEYWALEEAKIRRQPAEKEFSRRIALVMGGASGIGREVAQMAGSARRACDDCRPRRGRRSARCRGAEGGRVRPSLISSTAVDITQPRVDSPMR